MSACKGPGASPDAPGQGPESCGSESLAARERWQKGSRCLSRPRIQQAREGVVNLSVVLKRLPNLVGKFKQKDANVVGDLEALLVRGPVKITTQGAVEKSQRVVPLDEQ